MKNNLLSDWIIKELSEIGEIVTGSTPPTNNADYYINGKYQFISPADIGDTKYIYNAGKKVTKLGLDKSRKLPKNSVVAVCIGSTIGKVGLTYDEWSCTNQQINSIVCANNYLPDFIYYSLFFNRDHWRQLRTPSPVPLLNKSVFSKYKLAIPSFNEQEKISHILATIQSAIEQQDKLIKTTTELKKAMMQKLFSEGLHGEKQKMTEIGLVPESWEITKLETLTKITSGGTPSRQNKSYYTGKILWVKSGELEDNTINDTEEKITEEAIKNSSAKVFPEKTVLIAMYGATVGKTAILNKPASTNQAVCAILPNDKTYISEYLRFYLMTIREKFLGQRYGGAQPNISQTIIKNTEICLPSIPEQKEIADILSKLDLKIDSIQKKKTILEQLFNSMLSQLMTGQIRVNKL